MSFHITRSEEQAAQEFIETPKCKAALNAGGRWALVFGPHNGIGIPVEVTVMHPDGRIYRQDVTDVSNW